MSRLTRDGTAETVSRYQILWHEQSSQGNINFPCSADHERDWQPYPADPSTCYMCDHTYIHKYVRGLVDWKLFVFPFQRINSSILNSINRIDSSDSINSVNIFDSVNSISQLVLVANTMNYYFITLQYCCQSRSSSWSAELVIESSEGLGVL